MAKINVATKHTLKTYEGAPAKHINPGLQLMRTVLANMLWEDTFYEDGESVAKRILDTIPKVEPDRVRDIAIAAREEFKLRHVPLLLARGMAKLQSHRHLVAETLEKIIQRPDELTEFVAIYWKDGKQPLSAQVKKGLARAFLKFNEYQLAKYNQDGKIKLRDVLFLSHAKPKTEEQKAIFKKLVDGNLATPDTWEVKISATKGEGKREEWERLIKEKKLGALAVLRNLRNLQQSGIPAGTIRQAISEINTKRVLPFRFISAATHAPDFEPELEKKMFECLQAKPKWEGRTAIAVDCSGSMEAPVSGKSKIQMNDAACALAMLLREMTDDLKVFAYGSETVPVPPRRGFALRDAIKAADPGYATHIGKCVETIHKAGNFDRIIIVTDEQSHDKVFDPYKKGYVINVAPYQNGIGYGAWCHIDGWSEATLDYIDQFEKLV